MKLQYKNNQWEDEKGVPIAPEDQEKVHYAMWLPHSNAYAHGGLNPLKNWQPEIGNLYDSGDLEFELRTEMSERWVPSYNDPDNFNCNPMAEPIDYWFLKDKPKQLSDYRTVTDKAQVEETAKCDELSTQYFNKIVEVITVAGSDYLKQNTALRAIRALCEERLEKL